MSDPIKAGDWVTVVQCCRREAECKDDLGLVFKVEGAYPNGIMVACDMSYNRGLVAHPDPGRPPIPMAWLKKQPPTELDDELEQIPALLGIGEET